MLDYEVIVYPFGPHHKMDVLDPLVGSISPSHLLK